MYGYGLEKNLDNLKPLKGTKGIPWLWPKQHDSEERKKHLSLHIKTQARALEITRTQKNKGMELKPNRPTKPITTVGSH
jgi:hypothetical protein